MNGVFDRTGIGERIEREREQPRKRTTRGVQWESLHDLIKRRHQREREQPRTPDAEPQGEARD
jgi:hypothetical protein